MTTISSFRLLHKINPCYQHFTHREVHPVRRRAPPAVPAAATQGRELRVAPVGHLRVLPGSDPHADALHRHLGSPESHSRCRGLIRCQYWPSFSTCNPPATAPAAVVGREGRHHVVVSGVARHGGLPARGRRRRDSKGGVGGAAAQAVLLLLLVWMAVLPQVLRVQVDSGQVQYFGVHQWSLKLKRQCNRIRICNDINPLGLG